ELVFTSGGTEATNLALRGAWAALRRRGDGIVASAVEHPSVLEVLRDLESQGARVTLVRPGQDGTLDTTVVSDAVDEKTVLIAIMHANNETGAVHPIEA